MKIEGEVMTESAVRDLMAKHNMMIDGYTKEVESLSNSVAHASEDLNVANCNQENLIEENNLIKCQLQSAKREEDTLCNQLQDIKDRISLHEDAKGSNSDLRASISSLTSELLFESSI
jgi:hypothetical protein